MDTATDRTRIAPRSIGASQEELDVALTQCAAANNVVAAKALIACGADGNAFIHGGVTRPLLDAAKSGNTGMCDLLLRSNADINGQNIIGMTPLRAAVLSKKRETALWLIAHGANMTSIPAGMAIATIPLHGLTPRTAALRIDDKEQLAMLLKEGQPMGPDDDEASLIALSKALKKRDMTAWLQSLSAHAAITRAAKKAQLATPL